MVLDRIQEHLESIYGLRFALRVSDYLLDGPSAKALGGTGRAREELLLLEEDGALELGLYVDAEVLARLERLEPADAVTYDLSGFCEAAEGVSHFVYVQHTADNDRHVSLLEMEAQAEVDKFASCVLLRWNEGDAPALLSKLMDQVSYNTQLTPAEHWRYQEANRVARAYCKRLLRLILSRRLDLLLAELRHSYRMGAEAKLRYFERAA